MKLLNFLGATATILLLISISCTKDDPNIPDDNDTKKAIIDISPTSISHTTTQGSDQEFNEIISITNIGDGVLNYSATSNSGWVVIENPTGTAPANINLTINTSGLALGTYSGSVNITSNDATNSKTCIINLTISNPQSGWVQMGEDIIYSSYIDFDSDGNRLLTYYKRKGTGNTANLDYGKLAEWDGNNWNHIRDMSNDCSFYAKVAVSGDLIAACNLQEDLDYEFYENFSGTWWSNKGNYLTNQGNVDVTIFDGRPFMCYSVAPSGNAQRVYVQTAQGSSDKSYTLSGYFRDGAISIVPVQIEGSDDALYLLLNENNNTFVLKSNSNGGYSQLGNDIEGKGHALAIFNNNPVVLSIKEVNPRKYFKITGWNGNNWIDIDEQLIVGNDVSSVSAATGSDKLYVSYRLHQDEELIIKYWNGSSWTNIDSPVPAGFDFYSSICAVHQENLIISYTGNHPSEGFQWKTLMLY